MNPIEAYTRKAGDYARYRPAYSAGAFEALFELTGLDSGWTVADIGSGTGNVARHLVGRAGRVYAIEPNEAMRREAEGLLESYASFVSIEGTAERTGLEDCSIDLITVGQALHWFDARAAGMEFARILKPGGWLAVIWNRFGDAEGPDTGGIFDPVKPRHFSFPMSVSEAWEQYIGGARSAAGSPSPGEAGYGEFEAKHRAVFEAGAVDGVIKVEYSTELVLGRLDVSSPE